MDEHERSKMHRELVVKLAATASSTHVGAQLNSQHLLDQWHYQHMLTKLLSSIRVLACQGLPLHGHHEDLNSLVQTPFTLIGGLS